MDKKNKKYEENNDWMEEFYTDDDWEDDDPYDIYGNPYGAGRYRYSRSSEDCEAMLLGDDAEFNGKYNRWFEYMGCGYACSRDGQAMMEADEIDMWDFHTENPQVNCREGFFDLEYGDTDKDVAFAFIYLTEYEAGKHRSFSFSLADISMSEMEKYIAAIETWHGTGKFNIGQYHGIPAYDSWDKN